MIDKDILPVILPRVSGDTHHSLDDERYICIEWLRIVEHDVISIDHMR